MPAKFGTCRGVGRVLREDALEPEHQPVAHLPARGRRRIAGVHLGQRVVERRAASGARSECLQRILVRLEERLAEPGLGSLGRSSQVLGCVRRQRRDGRRLVHSGSTSLPCRSFRRVALARYRPASGTRQSIPQLSARESGQERPASSSANSTSRRRPPLGHARLVEMLRDAAEPEREAGTEQEARVDVGRLGNDAVLEDVARLVGERLEHRAVELVDRPRRVLDDHDVAALARGSRATRESGKRSGHVSCRCWRTWFATFGPTSCRRTDGAIGRPIRSTASSVSSTVFPRSSACVMIDPWRPRSRFTTNAVASCTRTPRLAQLLGDRPRGRDRDVVRCRCPHELDEGQHRHRVEEVHSDHAFGVLEARAHLGDRKRRGVRRDDAFGRDDALELGEHVLLHLHLLEDRLDDESRSRRRRRIRCPRRRSSRESAPSPRSCGLASRGRRARRGSRRCPRRPAPA